MKFKKTLIWVIIVCICGILCIKPIRTARYEKQYTEEVYNILYPIVNASQYGLSVSVEDIMKHERYILLELSEAFGDLTREKKHDYLKNELCNKLRSAYSDWVGENRVYHNKLWEYDSLTFLRIPMVIKCGEKTYKYGYLVHNSKYDYFEYEENFVDEDGTSYRFVNDAEKDAYYDNVSSSTVSSNDTVKKDYRKLSYYSVASDDEMSEAWAMTMSFVKDKLKSPKSADFPSYKNSNVSIKKSGNYYKVTGYVDAENSFGAEMRATFSLYMERSGSKFVLKECNIFE